MRTIIPGALLGLASISCSIGPTAADPAVLIEGVCDVSTASAAMSAHFEAIASGDAEAAERGVAHEPQFEWYAVYPSLWSAEIDTNDRSSLGARLQELADSDWTLTDLNLDGIADEERQLVQFGIEATVMEFGPMLGKGAVACEDSTIVVLVLNLRDQTESASE